MPNEWIAKALGDTHHIVVLLAVNAKWRPGDPEQAMFKIGIHPGLRDLEQHVFDRMLDGLEEGLQQMRVTPLDDLYLIYRDQV